MLFWNMVEPAPGILLIADPFLKDPNFIRTVILVCEHQEQGSFGFVLNRQFNHTLDELVPGLEGHPLTVHYGGPVQKDTLHFIHQCPDLIPESCKVGKDIYWGGNFESVSALIRSNSLDQSKIKFFIGYSGWGTGQLDEEMKEKSWLTLPATRNLVFASKPGEVWKESVCQLGDDYKIMVNFPIDPQLN
jgi:putative transcriptional regulator